MRKGRCGEVEVRTFLLKINVVSSACSLPSYFFVRPPLSGLKPIALLWHLSKACLTNLGPLPKWKTQ